jgi:hypothetical protein
MSLPRPAVLHPVAELALAAGVGIAVAALSGCDRAREQAFSRQLDAFERFHRVAWGEALPDEGRTEHRRRFDCIWDALVAAGRDPVVELGCWTRYTDATAACLETGEDIKACLSRGAAACDPSPAYLTAAKTCKAAQELHPD